MEHNTLAAGAEEATGGSSRIRCRANGEVSARGRPMCAHGEMVLNGTRNGKPKYACPASREASWERYNGRKPKQQDRDPYCRRIGTDPKTGRPMCEHGLMLPNGHGRWICRDKRKAIETRRSNSRRQAVAPAPEPEPSSNGHFGTLFADMVTADALHT
jgi:hypothetical protein